MIGADPGFPVKKIPFLSAGGRGGGLRGGRAPTYNSQQKNTGVQSSELHEAYSGHFLGCVAENG